MVQKAVFVGIFLSSLVSHSSCPHYLRYIQVLDKLVPMVQSSYSLMIQGPRQEDTSDGEAWLSTLKTTLHDVDEDLGSVARLMETASLFSLSSILPCKLNQTCLFKNNTSWLQMWETFVQRFEKGIQDLGLGGGFSGEASSVTVSEAFQKMLPSEGFEFQVAKSFQNLATSYPTTASQTWLSLWGVLSAQMVSRCEIFASLEAGLCRKTQKYLCKAFEADGGRTALPELFMKWSGIFRSIQRSADLALDKLQSQQTTTSAPHLMEMIQNRLQRPLLSSEGYPVGFIEEDPSQTFFIQKDGIFYNATQRRVWDPETKTHRRTTVWEPLDIDPVTRRVRSPAAFRGLPEPRLAFIKWDDYISTIEGHLDNVEAFLRRLCFEAKKNYEEWSTVVFSENENP